MLSTTRFLGWRQGTRSLHARPLSTPGAASVRWPSPPAPGSPLAPPAVQRLRASPLNPYRSGTQRSQISKLAPGNAVTARRPLSTPGVASVRWPSPPAPGSFLAPTDALRLRAGPLNPYKSGAQRNQISRLAPGNAVAARPHPVEAWGRKRPLAKPSRPWVASRPTCRPAIEGRLPQSL